MTDQEHIQKMAVELVARNPAGRGLQLIGGFRYRLIDDSPRLSDDIDYHWSGDLARKRDELVSLFERKLIPAVRRTLGYDGSVNPMDHPADESVTAKGLVLAFYKQGVARSRIELPVEITTVQSSDPPAVRTVSGTLLLTLSDQDMVESKIVALLNRVYPTARDFVDLFLFERNLSDDSPQRVADKLARAGVSAWACTERMHALRTGKERYIRSIALVVDEQLDPEAAETLHLGGGPAMVYETALRLLTKAVSLFDQRPAP